MSISSRDDALTRRKARIVDYIKQGKPPLEICDLEGLDPANEPRRMRKEIADPMGLTINTAATAPPPAALMEVGTKDLPIKANLKTKLAGLRNNHHYVDVGHMVGLTNKEQIRAMTSPYTHDWTISQIQRLAVACGMTFEQMLAYMHKPPIADFRIKP